MYVLISIVSVALGVPWLFGSFQSRISSIPAPVPTKEVVVYEPLHSYTSRVMDTCGYKASEARRLVLAREIAEVVEDTLVTRAQQEAFVALLCIESGFDHTARSSAGAVGIAQLMPRYFLEFATRCPGLGAVEAGDIHHPPLNLRVGACRFSALLGRFEGNIALALSGYNSGADSSTTRKLGALVGGHPETMAYVAKFYSLQERIRIGDSK